MCDPHLQACRTGPEALHPVRTSACVPVLPHAGCGLGGGWGYRVAERTVHESACKGVPSPACRRSARLAPESSYRPPGFVQAALVGRFTGKAERIVMHAI